MADRIGVDAAVVVGLEVSPRDQLAMLVDSPQGRVGKLPVGRKLGLMSGDEYQPVAVSRRIGAPAGMIFPILADPGRHRELDGSGMLRGVVSGTTICGVGDVFVMRMYFDELGDYQMINHVVEYEPDRRIGWEPEAGPGHPNAEPGAERPARWGQRWSFELTPDGPDATVVTETFDCSQVPEDQRVDIDYGNIWVEGMAETLQRLDALCARPGNPAGAS